MAKTVLILGANGRFGRNAAAAFAWSNWNVVRFDRKADTLPDAAWGAEIIVNAWNPAYPDWEARVPELTEQVITTAKETGATVLIPGNIYNYGATMPSELREITPHAPSTHLGEIREQMERAYRDAGVKTVILRAGEFIDTQRSGNWYDQIITAKIEQGKVSYPGDLDTPHAWAFLHDLADAAVALAEQADRLPHFADINFPGYTLTARELHAGLEAATGKALSLNRMAWWPITLARPVWPMARHLLSLRYLWDTPHAMASDTFAQHLPDFEPTPLVEALKASLPDQVDPDRVMPRRTVGTRRPFNLCCSDSKMA